MATKRKPSSSLAQYRQGDVLISAIPPDKIPSDAAPVPRDPTGAIVLAYGEATGHSHAIHAALEDAMMLATSERRFLRVAEPVSVTHEEHGPIDLQPGTYEVTRQREYVEEVRNVAD